MAWNEFKANHLNKILREDLDREFEVDLKSHSDIYQPRKKWTIKAQVSQAHRILLSKCANVVTLSRTQRKLYSTAVRFGRYSLTLALRSVLLHFSQNLELMQILICYWWLRIWIVLTTLNRIEMCCYYLPKINMSAFDLSFRDIKIF